jgi:1,4-alpha-glucan branching enzyme
MLTKNGSKESAKGKTAKPVSPTATKQNQGKKDQIKKGKGLQEIAPERETQSMPEKGNGDIERKYSSEASSCKVIFRLPCELAGVAKKASLAGDFTHWEKGALPMKRLKSGDFEITLELPSNAEYRFRYLIDEYRWENDPHADAYNPNPYGCDDSVLIV